MQTFFDEVMIFELVGDDVNFFRKTLLGACSQQQTYNVKSVILVTQIKVFEIIQILKQGLAYLNLYLLFLNLQRILCLRQQPPFANTWHSANAQN